MTYLVLVEASNKLADVTYSLSIEMTGLKTCTPETTLTMPLGLRWLSP